MATPEELLKEAKKLIGKETKPIKVRYPVEYEPLRRWCVMADNSNPLFLDPEYAKKTKYGEVICPPGAVSVFTRVAEWPPGKVEESLIDTPHPGTNLMNLGTEWEFLKPVNVGETLTYKWRHADIYIKSIRYDPQAFWQIDELIFTNEAGEEVAIMRRTWIFFRNAAELKRDGVTVSPT